MFAHVYLIKRLPRRFTFFDYEIPNDLNVHTGDLVQVPFKYREELGVVGFITNDSDFHGASKISCVIKSKFFDCHDIRRFENIAQVIYQSPSSLLTYGLQGYRENDRGLEYNTAQNQSLTVSKIELEVIKKCFAKLERAEEISVQLSVEGQMALIKAVRNHFDGQLLIIVPRALDAERLQKSMAPEAKSVILHGKTKSWQRTAIINSWQDGQIQTLIGTRQSTLLPANHLKNIIVFDATNDDHVGIERNPRFDARLAAALLAKQHQAKLVFLSAIPRVEDLFTNRIIISSETPPHQVINLKAQEEWTGQAFLTETLQKAIEKALQNGQRVLCSFNRKGVAKRLQCKDCGHIPLCGTCGAVPEVREKDLNCPICSTEMWVPKKCPACQKTSLSNRGVGNLGIKNMLQKAFPGAKVGILEKNKQEHGANIIIATEYFFSTVWPPFSQKQFGLIVELCADQALSVNDFRTAEKAAYKLHRLVRLAAQQKAECIIQTWLPDVINSMLRVDQFLKKELEIRQTYQLPPVTEKISIKCKEPDILSKDVERVLSKQNNYFKTNDQIFEVVYNDRFPRTQEYLGRLNDNCIIQTDLQNYEFPRNPNKSE
ncbi:MAG: hypothetical protein ABH846_02705 [Patescibacteria group bacterium]